MPISDILTSLRVSIEELMNEAHRVLCVAWLSPSAAAPARIVASYLKGAASHSRFVMLPSPSLI